MDNFPVRLPPDPPQNEFASLTSFSIGRGAVAPSQTHPGGEERAATTGTDCGDATEKPKRRSPERRRDESSGPKQLRRGSQKGQEATKTALQVLPRYSKTKTRSRTILSGSRAFLTAGAGTRNPPTEPRGGRRGKIEIRCISFRRIREKREWRPPRWSTSG